MKEIHDDANTALEKGIGAARVRRVSIKQGESTVASGKRRRLPGQAMVIVALASVLLIVMVGLAVDGGSMYNQRRVAQNGADGAAMAGTRQMLIYAEAMARAIGHPDDSYPSAAQAMANEDTIRQVIERYAASNGVLTTTLTAYFVDNNKNIISVPVGENHGQGNCGVGAAHGPCQVGSNGLIPWVEGATGITIQQADAQTDSFFVRIIGWSKISAAATATAFMGVAVDSGYDAKLLPVGFFTDTNSVNNLVPGQNYTLIQFDVYSNTLASGNWGWINYTGSSPNANVLQAWINCGFNPSLLTDADWHNWCLRQGINDNTNNAHGPIVYWTGWPADGIPITGSYQGVTLRFGDGINGWWLAGTTGAKSSACHDLSNVATGSHYNVPMFDTRDDGSGSGTLLHLYRLGQFRISTVDIKCNGQSQHFNIQGVFEQTFLPGSSGWHGDIWHTSDHVIFLAP